LVAFVCFASSMKRLPRVNSTWVESYSFFAVVVGASHERCMGRGA
jgi:hypothetical protein